MTTVPSHGMALAYHNKAMDLNSLVINVNEELLTTSEERRAKLVELQQKFSIDIDSALKRFSHVTFGRATLKLFGKGQSLHGGLGDPAGQVLLFPLKIHGDAMTCTLITAGLEPIDHRRVIPTMEKIQACLDEVRAVTLVRGINFVQQDAILQRFANRFMQHAESDYVEGRWGTSKPSNAQPSPAVVIDLPASTERQEWTRVATYRMPWRVDAITGEFIPNADETTQEAEQLAAIEDEYLIQFNIVCPALPIVPRLLETACAHLHGLWKGLAQLFVPVWKHDLVLSLANKIMADIDVGAYSVKMTPGNIDREIQDKVLNHVRGFDEYAGGLEARFRDLKSQPVDANIFGAMLEGFKTTVGRTPAIDELAVAIKAAHSASLVSTIAPGMSSDSRVAEGTLLQVKEGISGLRTRLSRSASEEVVLAMLQQASAQLDARLVKEVLQNEKGIVKSIGTAVLKLASQDFLRLQIQRACDPCSANTPVVELASFKADYLATLKSCLAAFKIDIGQLIQLAAELLDEAQQDVIAPYLQKFLALKRDVVFLKEFLLRADVLNKFLEKHYEHFYDPKSFGKLLGDWVSSELAQLPIEWGSLLGNWFSAFTNVFQIQHAQKSMARSEIVRKFYEFTKIVADEQNTFDNTFAIMSSFVGTLSDSKDKLALTEYLKRFEQSQAFQEKFPRYLEGKISKVLDEVKPNDLEVTLKDKAGIVAAIARRVEGGIPGMQGGEVVLPSEIVIHFEKDSKIEFKIALDAGPDGLTATLLTNWFRLVDAF